MQVTNIAWSFDFGFGLSWFDVVPHDSYYSFSFYIFKYYWNQYIHLYHYQLMILKDLFFFSIQSVSFPMRFWFVLNSSKSLSNHSSFTLCKIFIQSILLIFYVYYKKLLSMWELKVLPLSKLTFFICFFCNFSGQRAVGWKAKSRRMKSRCCKT